MDINNIKCAGGRPEPARCPPPLGSSLAFVYLAAVGRRGLAEEKEGRVAAVHSGQPSQSDQAMDAFKCLERTISHRD